MGDVKYRLDQNGQLPEQESSLTRRVIRGGFWIFSLRVINRALGFVRKIVLARLLEPQDFGLFGIALLVIATLETFSQTGIQETLIRSSRKIAVLLDTAWTVSICRGILIFIVLWVSAPWVAGFFHSPQAVTIIRVVGLQPLVLGFTNIGTVYFQKELAFNKQFAYELSISLTHLTIALVLAFVLRNVWALVYGGLAAGLVRTILSYRIHPFRPRWRLDPEQIKEFFHFGKWVLLSSVLVFLNSQGDDVFVGKLLGVAALGMYQLAYAISNLSATEITRLISHVTFPAYSRIRHDPTRLTTAYLTVSKLNAFVTVPVAGAIVVLGEEFIDLVLGPQWLPMAPAMQMLALWGCIRSIGASTGPIFYSLGKPELATRFQFLQLVLLIVLIYPLSAHLGIFGTALAVTLACLPPNILAVRAVFKLLKSGLGRFCKDILIPAFAAGAAVVGLTALKAATPVGSAPELFILFALAYLVVYLGSLWLLDRLTEYRMGTLVRAIAEGWQK